MNIIIDNNSMIPIYEQIMDQIRGLILNGDLVANDPLPSVRSLSRELRISALTVKKAYDQLEKDGLIQTIHGKGSYVLEANSELLRNEQYLKLEEQLQEAVDLARSFQLNEADVRRLFDLLMEDYDVNLNR